MHLIRILGLLLILVARPWPAHANNTGGVFGPVVQPDWAAMQYRIAQDPDSDALAQRLHYEQAQGDRLMWRLIGQLSKTPVSDFDFDYVQAELFVEFSESSDVWKQGVRLDLRLRDEDRPNQVGLNWMHELPLGSQWRARMLALSTVQWGNRAVDGVFLETRGSIGRPLGERTRMDLELFSGYGNSRSLRGWQAQTQQLGPSLSVDFGDGWSLYGGPLFGLTRASPDVNLRAWLTKRF